MLKRVLCDPGTLAAGLERVPEVKQELGVGRRGMGEELQEQGTAGAKTEGAKSE